MLVNGYGNALSTNPSCLAIVVAVVSLLASTKVMRLYTTRWSLTASLNPFTDIIPSSSSDEDDDDGDNDGCRSSSGDDDDDDD